MRESPIPNRAVVNRQQGRPRWSTAWFAGVDLRLLARAPSERLFYDTLGVAVLLLSCASGLAAALAVGQILNVSASSVWWVGLLWAIILAGAIERLVLQLPTGRKRWLLLAVLPRVFLSMMLAVQFAEPVVLAIFHEKISGYLAQTKEHAEQSQASKTASVYEPKVVEDEHKIAAIKGRERALANEAEHFRFLSSCEAGTPTCSVTRRAGCGSYCEHYARTAAAAENTLRSAEPADHRQIGRLELDARELRASWKRQESEGDKAIAGDTGLLAREEALSHLEKSPAVALRVWFLRLFFLSLDLLPLGAKVLRILTVDSPLEDLARASRRRDRLGATREQAEAEVEEKRIEEQARADIEVNSVLIQRDAETRLAGHDAETSYEGSRGRRPVPAIEAWNLETFVDNMSTHEAGAVDIHPALRRGALVGLALIVAVAVMTLALPALAGVSVAGGWVVAPVLAGAAALAVYTRGFQRAPAWALRATLATLLSGLVLPVAFFAMNI